MVFPNSAPADSNQRVSCPHPPLVVIDSSSPLGSSLLAGISLEERARRKARALRPRDILVLVSEIDESITDPWRFDSLTVEIVGLGRENPQIDGRVIESAGGNILLISTKYPLANPVKVSPEDVEAQLDSGHRPSDGLEWTVLEHASSPRVSNADSLRAAEALVQKLLRERLLKTGVVLPTEGSVLLHEDIQVGPGTVIESGVALLHGSRVGPSCKLEQGCRLEATTIGESSRIRAYSVLEDSVVGTHCLIGPFAHLRPGSRLGNRVVIGNFVETKAVEVGDGVKAKHLSYLGDTIIGKRTNVGAGVITCNYDGEQHHRTSIGEKVFVGSDSQLIAPVQIEDGAFVAAGTTVTERVPANALAIGRSRMHIVEGWRTRRQAPQRLQTSKHFHFDLDGLESVVAHDGQGEILTRRVLTRAAGSACNFLDLTIVPPGATIGLHTHARDNEEHYIIVAGEGEMRMDDKVFPVRQGHVTVNRPGGTHGLRNTGTEDLWMVVVEIPLYEPREPDRG